MAQSRIPIVVCHGVERRDYGWAPQLTSGHFERFMRTAYDLGFVSVTYDGLAAWRDGAADLPERAFLIDLDHPVSSQRHEVYEILVRYSFTPTLFVVTGPLDGVAMGPGWEDIEFATWSEVEELARAGWLIGAHTVTHPDLSELSLRDPSGELVRAELDAGLAAIERHLGLRPLDFAYTGTSFSTVAEAAVAERFRFGRLWIVGAGYQMNGTEVRFSDVVGVSAPDEADGGPPTAARYVTRTTPPLRLPAMDLQRLVWEDEAYRAFLLGSLEPAAPTPG
jgi:peptidoglycan/xylan/chitin deacetylase (PgdA/CDA1 family)